LGGGPSDSVGSLMRFGMDSAGNMPPWQWLVDTNNTCSFSYNGLAATSPINLIGNTGNHPYTAQMLNGAYIGTLYNNSASAMPTTGTYTKGDWVENDNPSISGGKVLKGWKRLTTGSAHVAGTDWTPLYMTTT
jgi:hypothetical protein